MEKMKQELRAALSKVPGVPNLDSLIDHLQSDEEFEAMNTAFDATPMLELNLDVDLDFDFSVAPEHVPSAPIADDSKVSPKAVSRTTKISIRIATEVLVAIQAIAKNSCIGYQTAINRILKSTVSV